MKTERIDTREKELEVLDLNEEDEENEDLVTEMDLPEEPTRRPDAKKKAKKEKEEFRWKRELLSWVMTFVVAIGAALILKNFIIINATVPTGSMENTIMTGDNLFGFRLSYLNSEPERGDIIIFKYPDDETQKYVKRIIGLPGEKITITQGKVYINDSKEPLQEDYLKEEWIRATGPYEFQIPENSYLVMGDNRNNSNDSRYWEHPFVAKDKIIGKALFVYYPFEHFGKIE